ncbi:SDR family NAD(P)-dependent oxidoreductase [Novosphingobium album (ex Hu et al. 2023)]|uniref:SDR family NAD(P)-dependent oxidoreductase n=1 Tax=Novosphingobium album (ex Hu et al. 2023) TaxID=2930093 RepID=A0ABT0B5Q9_9SPHN|nr:SDR family NAD(P)-dependent oxidoreductase [Novosphingobium album (ex Hu et al. 2023)]MCJ2180211.1 SDR family NAD(P)-dependent oxidoreductase [Novosphingobium album (ex Hu et al. 2023)]
MQFDRNGADPGGKMQSGSGEVRFDDCAVLVTGAGRGLGYETALLLASRGAKVVVADNGSDKGGDNPDVSRAAAVVREIRDAGGAAVECTADLSFLAGAEQAVDTCLSAFGRLDALAHLASPCPPLKTPSDLVERDLDLVLRTNAQAGLWLARTAWPHMASRQFGRMVFASSAGALGAPANADYSTAKSAMIGMTRCLAVDGAAHGILVNAIAPAAMTRMTEGFHPGAYADWFARTMQSSSVAPAVAYLLAHACELTGELFSIGGGRIARIVFAETEGEMMGANSIEAVRDCMPDVLADTSYFYPKNLQERSEKVAGFLGFSEKR